jgi:hypothetical protein
MMDGIIKTVSEFTGIPIDDILSRKRDGEICEARRIFIYLAYSVFGKSRKNIAIYLHRTRQDISIQLLLFDQELRIYKVMDKKIRELKDAIL